MIARGPAVVGGAVLVVGVFMTVGAYKAIQAERSAPPAVQIGTIPIMSRQHVKVGEAHPAYRSNPPTSGPHYDAIIMAAIPKEPPVDEALVALLERGYVWISYNPATADQVSIETLNKIPQEDPTLSVVVTARPQDDTPIAIAGWGKVMKLQHFYGTPEAEDRALHTFMRSLPQNAPDYRPSPAPAHG